MFLSPGNTGGQFVNPLPLVALQGLRKYLRVGNRFAQARQAVAEGWTLEQTRASDRLTEDAGYEPIRFIVSLGLDREFVLQRAWEEATGNFERIP